MLYLIKSPKWTRHNKKDTYWEPNQCGYTAMIADAGFYTEEEMLDITKRCSKDGALAIPVTNEIIEFARKQCEEQDKQLEKDMNFVKEQYHASIAHIEKQQGKNQERYLLLDTLKESAMEEFDT